ncbi:flippase [Methanolobus profundi]|uniref:Membrane protein involved in the export of O-antigen and teichoic acid n=1 Tax=Methanolobus profundi TaxID=487685 RepID=A0A1I4RVG4_9EURY|nr:flippase [Methanolobus profundi]SFM56235.1 Membrane protein involved in the export of O-antigen and teichoic acid [Methanolobus profundi]
MSILNMSKTMKDVQWSFISLATVSLSHLILRIILGRELGPSRLGVYTLVFTIYMFGMQFAAFGIGAALTKYIAEFSDNINQIKKYISSGIAGSIITGVIMGIALLLSSNIIANSIFTIPEMTNLLKTIAICFPFIAMHKAAIGALNGFRNMKAYAFLNILLNISVLFLSAFLVLFLKMNVYGAVLGFVLPTIVIGLLSIIPIHSYLLYPSISLLQNSILKEILNFGFYVVLGNSIGYIYAHIDSLMIGYYLNETEVGFYAVSMIFIQGITLIPSAIQRVTTPMIARSFAKKEYESILNLLKSVTLKVLIISLFFSLILLMFGEKLIVLIFEDAYLPAYTPLLILLIGYTIYSMFMSIGTFYASIGRVQLSYQVALFSALLSILMNTLLIPNFGIIGAAIATSFTLILLTVFHYIIIKHIISQVTKYDM